MNASWWAEETSFINIIYYNIYKWYIIELIPPSVLQMLWLLISKHAGETCSAFYWSFLPSSHLFFSIGLYQFTQKISISIHSFHQRFISSSRWSCVDVILISLAAEALVLLTTASRQQVPWQPPLPLTDGIIRMHRSPPAASSIYFSSWVLHDRMISILSHRIAIKRPFYCSAGKVRHD